MTEVTYCLINVVTVCNRKDGWPGLTPHILRARVEIISNDWLMENNGKQCFRCQGFGHSNFNLLPRCVKCLVHLVPFNIGMPQE